MEKEIQMEQKLDWKSIWPNSGLRNPRKFTNFNGGTREIKQNSGKVKRSYAY